MPTTKANINRRVRQDQLREWLSKKCTAQHLVDNLEKIEDLDPKAETFCNNLAKYKVANDQRLKILNKYLPDLKSEEVFDGLKIDKEVEEISDERLQAILAGDK